MNQDTNNNYSNYYSSFEDSSEQKKEGQMWKKFLKFFIFILIIVIIILLLLRFCGKGDNCTKMKEDLENVIEKYNNYVTLNSDRKDLEDRYPIYMENGQPKRWLADFESNQFLVSEMKIVVGCDVLDGFYYIDEYQLGISLPNNQKGNRYIVHLPTGKIFDRYGCEIDGKKFFSIYGHKVVSEGIPLEDAILDLDGKLPDRC